MLIEGHERLGHLTYCTNIHAGESWPDMIAGLRRWVPEVKARVAPDRPFGLGLRIAADAARTLADRGKLAELKAFLADTGCYVFTINGFPYGAFHGQPVKSEVYAPDWRTPERLAYTNMLADLLVEMLPEGQDGSISTVPGSFKPWGLGHEAAIADGLVDHVAHLVAIRERTGRTISLALEPEPCCLLETIAETVDYFTAHVFSGRAVARLAAATGLADADAEAALRRHIGVCYDVCHAAVEYEDPAASIAALGAAGIAIPKVQLSSALRIAKVDATARAALARFNEPVYLHQVIARQRPGAGLERFVDLPNALARGAAADGAEWRVHFHVPVFLERLAAFGTTQSVLREILDLHRRQPISSHLEVETYTWDVLPDEYRGVSVAEAIARELDWVRSRLAP